MKRDEYIDEMKSRGYSDSEISELLKVADDFDENEDFSIFVFPKRDIETPHDTAERWL